MKFSFIILVLFTSSLASAQTQSNSKDTIPVERDRSDSYEYDDELPDEEEIFEFYAVQEKATFPGGDDSLMRFISKNIRYPQQAIDMKLSATIYIQFVVNKDGALSDIKSMRPSELKAFDTEAIRVIKKTDGMWTPAMQRDMPVRMQYRIPIRFVLK
jgi:protein TonB